MDNITINQDVIYITSEEQAINYKWDKRHNALKNIQVLSIDDAMMLSKNEQYRFGGTAQIKEGDVYFKHPSSEKEYIGIEELEDRIFEDKINGLGIVTRFLGVTEFSVKAEFEEEQKVEYDVKGGLKTVKVKIDVKVKKSKESYYSKKYDRHEEYRDAEMTHDSYSLAEEAAEKYGLLQYNDIRYLLAQRKPDCTNQLTSFSVETEVSKSLDTLLDTAITLNAMAGAFQLSTSFKESVSKRNKVKLKTYIRFK